MRPVKDIPRRPAYRVSYYQYWRSLDRLLACGYANCRLSLWINGKNVKTKNACYKVNSTWSVESCRNYNVLRSTTKQKAKWTKGHFILVKPDQEGGEKLRDSKWTYGNHEIRRISEYNGLVFFLVYQMVSRKTPSFTGFGTMCDELTYSIVYNQARKQGWISLILIFIFCERYHLFAQHIAIQHISL